MNEPFSIKKFLDFSPHAWTKIFGLGLKVFVLALVVFGAMGIINKIFPKAPTNVNQPEITVEEGGQVTYHVTQKSGDDRAWWIPSPFVEIFGQVESNENDIIVGSRFGARWEW